MKKLVVFDLDGTLLNTIADLANSTNYALERCGYPTHAVEEYNFFVGNGINKLFERALPESRRTAVEIQRVRAEFLAHYNAHNADDSTPYPGVEALLRRLQEQQVALAVASNKYHAATQKLIAHYFPDIRFVAVFGQREGVNIKPDPTVIFDIMAIAGVGKEEILYVGDSGVDMQTARYAGVTSVGVTWGFRPRTELEQYSPDYIIDQAEAILEVVSDSFEIANGAMQ